MLKIVEIILNNLSASLECYVFGFDERETYAFMMACVCMYVCMCVCVYVCMCVCVCVCDTLLVNTISQEGKL